MLLTFDDIADICSISAIIRVTVESRNYYKDFKMIFIFVLPKTKKIKLMFLKGCKENLTDVVISRI